MLADDGNLYVVKFQDNPQGTRVLANEMLAAKLAEGLGLPVPPTAVVELHLQLSEELYFETPSGRQPIRPGLHLGSRLVITSREGRSYDVLPESLWHEMRSLDDFIGIQLFDLWTCNRDTRQVVFWKYSREQKYSATFIDNGHCFGGPEWIFAHLIFPITNFIGPVDKAWLRWADRIATFSVRRFELECVVIPPEWIGNEKRFDRIFEELETRQAIIAAVSKRLSTLIVHKDSTRLPINKIEREHLFRGLSNAGRGVG
jgi:hypothetical protein